MSDMKTLLENFSRFTGGDINIEPLSDEEQESGAEAYYELFDFLMNSQLPGDKPSDKLQYALRWIAKFEQGGEAGEVGFPKGEDHHGPIDDSPWGKYEDEEYPNAPWDEDEV